MRFRRTIRRPNSPLQPPRVSAFHATGATLSLPPGEGVGSNRNQWRKDRECECWIRAQKVGRSFLLPMCCVPITY
jgi:hypothetical protein